jgi:hypothetical protein
MGVSLEAQALAPLARWDEVGEAALTLIQTLDDERFPGAILPALRADGSAAFYAIADSAPVWRRLQPLLIAFAGPTFTNFEGVPNDLDAKDPLEQFLASAGVYAVARIIPGQFNNAPSVTLRALRSLQDAVARAPKIVSVRPEPTSALLARLQDALNSQDIEAARAVHATLRSELRLDAHNLLQLEFQILAVAGDWSSITSHPDFELLCASGPSPATAEILLEALYWTYFPNGNDLVDEELKHLCHSLLRHVGSAPSSTVEALEEKLSLSENQETPTEGEVVEAEPPEIAQKQASAAPASYEAPDLDPLTTARMALLSLASSDTNASPDTKAAALDLVGRLGPAERQQLLARPVFQAIWAEIEPPEGTAGPPTDWLEWLQRLDDSNFDAMSYARDAASEWRLPNSELDPGPLSSLVQQIDDVPDGLSGDRLNQALPYLVEWAGADPLWPRPVLCPLYLSLLTRIALSTRRGGAMIKSAALLLESALRSGLNQAEYRDAMQAIAMIATEALNPNTAYDVFELADVAASFPHVDRPAFDDAIAAVVSAAFAIFDRLSDGQKAACARLAAAIGWEAEVPVEEGKPVAEFAGQLSKMKVGVYTLTEGAGRNAQAVLATIAPGIQVELNHDHDATAALGALVTRADLFVIAWSSAKHAATNFIKSRRGSKPLVYAMGKGASSLIRAVEEFVAKN